MKEKKYNLFPDKRDKYVFFFLDTGDFSNKIQTKQTASLLSTLFGRKKVKQKSDVPAEKSLILGTILITHKNGDHKDYL